MSYLQFPIDISYKSNSSINYLTSIYSSRSGKEKRASIWTKAKIEYDLSNAIYNNEDIQKIIAFFKICKGRSSAFYFKDWLDFKAKQEFIAESNGQEKDFQLIKTYKTNSNEKLSIRTIKYPVKNSVKIFINNKLQKDNYTINYNTGVISFNKNIESNSKIYADFEFNILARFNTDQLKISIESLELQKIIELKIIEIKE